MVDDTLSGDESSQLYIRSHPPARLLPDGRPLLGLTAVDHVHSRRLLAQGRIDKMEAVRVFQQAIVAGDSGEGVRS